MYSFSPLRGSIPVIHHLFGMDALLNDETEPVQAKKPGLLSGKTEGDARWPGQWDRADIDVFFRHHAHRAIWGVAGCEDYELKDRLRHEEFFTHHTEERGLQEAVMCEPKNATFFWIRFVKSWHEDGTPLLSVLSLWPAMGQLSKAARQGAARMAMSERQFEAWMQKGEPTHTAEPRVLRWLEHWNATPNHPVRMQDLKCKRDRIEVTLTDLAGRSLMVGFLPIELRKMRRHELATDALFWTWLDERLLELRQRGLMRDDEWSVEDVASISMKNTCGLVLPDGTRTPPVINFCFWSRP